MMSWCVAGGQVTMGRIDLVAGPRFISEVVAYVYKSSVFRQVALCWPGVELSGE